MAYLKYTPKSGDVKPWSGPKIDNLTPYFLRLGINEKQTFSQISDIINFVHTDIGKCLIHSYRGLHVFEESNRLLTANLGHDCIKQVLFPFTNPYAPEYIVDTFSYRVCHFTFVSSKRVRSSLVTKLNFAIYIEFLFPRFDLPYLYIPLHPQYPLKTWKSPASEGFYAEFELFLWQKKSQNNSLIEVNDILNTIIQCAIKQIIAKCHLVRSHPSAAIRVPREILRDHFEVLWAKDTELRRKQLAKLQAKLEVSDTECVQAAALHD